MLERMLVIPLLAVMAVACASVPPPATRSPDSPAHPEASEAATPPLSPLLMSQPELAAPSPAAGASPLAGHVGRSEAKPAEENATAAPGPYACPMHPKVTSDKGGTCHLCGMSLVRTKPEPQR